ncbi:response regulator [Paucibacter sp. R3-3]|uniref:histidine kinase n=1 Tax=Roseateles agri TaxID=3098619 RepID=A0ABU5DS85_9BURK|nr:response regulator [Paucibacter sp. R3-3]MDY0748608.1 response regulator [Paucibacter sp. R3-3]
MSDDEACGSFRPIDRSQHLLLVVDDEPASLYATVRLLRQAGFRTREAATGAEGLAAATDEVSAMVVDVHLPDMDGFALCRELRSRPDTARMPVLHLTAAYVTDADKVRGLDSGADAYLTRPVEPAVLVATVQALVRTRMAEDAMRHSEAKFRAIYAQAPSGIGLLDAQGCFVEVNPALQRLMGREETALVGHAVAEFAPPEAVQAARDMALRDDGHLLSWEFPVRDPAGHLVHLEWNMSRDIEPGLDMVVVTDVSARVALEAQRKQLLERERVARSEAERINRSKDDFIAVLSHELRTPLNAIIQWAHLLMKRGGTPEQMRGLAAIDRNVKLQGRMITDLLDISRLNTGKLPMQLELLDPAELVSEAVQAMQQSFADNENMLTLELDDGGNGGFRPIRADASRLQQVIWNLLTNALKFSSRGGRIWVTLAQNEAGLALTVRDEGQGMTAEFLPLAFDRFSQSPSARRVGGLGLGLSIVKQLVEAHGGTIAVDSPGPGHGATFSVLLPAGAMADEAPSDEVTSPGELDTELAADPMLTGVKLLIVEDDREAGTMLQLILRERGAEVALAHDFDGAMALLVGSPRFDVLVSDIGLPDQDGYDLVRALRLRETAKHLPRLPAIALTAFTRPQDQEQALAAGFDLHCAKPVRHMRLIQMIQKLVEKRQSKVTS